MGTCVRYIDSPLHTFHDDVTTGDRYEYTVNIYFPYCRDTL